MNKVIKRNKKSITDAQRKDALKRTNEEKEKDQKMVKGMFKFYETRGGKLSFCYRSYCDEPIQQYNLYDGDVYSIPYGVAKHLNKNGWYPVHEYMMDEDNKPSMKVGKKVRRFGFQSLEFTEDSNLQASQITILTAEAAAI